MNIFILSLVTYYYGRPISKLRSIRALTSPTHHMTRTRHKFGVRNTSTKLRNNPFCFLYLLISPIVLFGYNLPPFKILILQFFKYTVSRYAYLSLDNDTTRVEPVTHRCCFCQEDKSVFISHQLMGFLDQLNTCKDIFVGFRKDKGRKSIAPFSRDLVIAR